jgi:hypothetical protein
MQGHISKSSYTRKQRKEFLRTWTAIGRAHVSASHGPDLFQLLDIASSSLFADHDCGDCGPLYTAHPSPAGSPLELSRPPTASAEAHLRMAATDQQITDRRISVVGPGQTLPVPAAGSPSCVPNSTVAISMSNPFATSTSFGSSGLRRKRQADSEQVSGVRPCLFGGFTSTAPVPPPPPPTGNMLFGPKPASGAAPAPPPIGNLFGPKPA